MHTISADLDAVPVAAIHPMDFPFACFKMGGLYR
jgi:hypothetical protein